MLFRSVVGATSVVPIVALVVVVVVVLELLPTLSHCFTSASSFISFTTGTNRNRSTHDAFVFSSFITTVGVVVVVDDGRAAPFVFFFLALGLDDFLLLRIIRPIFYDLCCKQVCVSVQICMLIVDTGIYVVDQYSRSLYNMERCDTTVVVRYKSTEERRERKIDTTIDQMVHAMYFLDYENL